MATTYDIEPNPIENGVQQAYQDIRASLEEILYQAIPIWDIRQTILLSLDDAVSNNWDELMASFWQGVKQDIELIGVSDDQT